MRLSPLLLTGLLSACQAPQPQGSNELDPILLQAASDFSVYKNPDSFSSDLRQTDNELDAFAESLQTVLYSEVEALPGKQCIQLDWSANPNQKKDHLNRDTWFHSRGSESDGDWSIRSYGYYDGPEVYWQRSGRKEVSCAEDTVRVRTQIVVPDTIASSNSLPTGATLTGLAN